MKYYQQKQSGIYCGSIVNEKTKHFNISNNKVNEYLSHIRSEEDDYMLFHMLREERADDVYYGAASTWWKKDEKDLTPLPFDE